MSWRDDANRVRLLKIASLLFVLIVFVGICIMSISFTDGVGFLTEPFVLQKQWSDAMTEFKRINFDVLDQIPRYAIGRYVRGLHLGSTNPFSPKPVKDGAYFVSQFLPSEIYELYTNELLAQGWHIWEEDLPDAESKVLKFWKGQACVEIRAQLWDDSAVAITNYTPSPPDEAPVSWFMIAVQHELDAVPEAPSPPDPTPFYCVPRSE